MTQKLVNRRIKVFYFQEIAELILVATRISIVFEVIMNGYVIIPTEQTILGW